MSVVDENNIVIGYEFLCKNEKCNYFNTGFSLYRSWPITNIDTVINSKLAPQDLKDHLVKSKQEGRTYALVILPNTEEMQIIGKRIQLFCKKDCIMWERDLVNKNDVLDMHCDKCNDVLVSADEAMRDGILCPSCGIRLGFRNWFSQI